MFHCPQNTKKDLGKNKNVKLPSLCEEYWKCPDCGLSMKREDRDGTLHECGETFCSNCQKYYLGMEHFCYMRSITTDSICDKLIFYDFECQQNEGIHTPNFVVAQTVCDLCESQPIDENAICYNCGDRCEICKPFNKKKMNMKETLVMVVVKGKKFSKERKQQNNFVIGLLMRETKQYSNCTQW